MRDRVFEAFLRYYIKATVGIHSIIPCEASGYLPLIWVNFLGPSRYWWICLLVNDVYPCILLKDLPETVRNVTCPHSFSRGWQKSPP